MSGSPYGSSQQQKKRRRNLLLLLFLPLAYLLGGASYAVVRGEPPTPTPIVISAATASPTEDGGAGETPSEDPTKTPKPSEVVAGVSASPSITPVPTANPSAVVIISDVTFRISGSVQNLLPGVTQTVPLTLTNPNGLTIYITSLVVRLPADSAPAGCRPADNIAVVQPDASVSNPIVVGAGKSVTLATAPRAPQMTLLDLSTVNQDVCKGKRFTLTFTGSAHS